MDIATPEKTHTSSISVLQGPLTDGIENYAPEPIDPAEVMHFNDLMNHPKGSDESTLARLITELQTDPSNVSKALQIQILATKIGFSLNFITAVVGKIVNAANSLLTSAA